MWRSPSRSRRCPELVPMAVVGTFTPQSDIPREPRRGVKLCQRSDDVVADLLWDDANVAGPRTSRIALSAYDRPAGPTRSNERTIEAECVRHQGSLSGTDPDPFIRDQLKRCRQC